MSTNQPKANSRSDPGNSDRIEVLCVDMNGILRGKWIPSNQFQKIMNGKVRLPLSTQSLDIWGDDNDPITGLSQSIGDPDGSCYADQRTLVPLPNGDGWQILTTLHEANGAPSFMDPRAILAAVVERFKRRGWTPVVSIELEFYLLDSDLHQTLQTKPPAALSPSGVPKGLQLYELDAMEALSEVLGTIRKYAAAQDVPADTLIAEFGPGQFEVNLWHRPDALAAADDALYFKRIVKRAAQQHRLSSTFMAKPYTHHAGSGMHLHACVYDNEGRNILDTDNGDNHLDAALGGVLHHLLDSQAVFAPHANSYRRFQPDCFAPTYCNWGEDHRGAAVRIPESSGPNARIEHRVAGADANPYLVTAVMLGSLLHGLEQRVAAPPGIGEDGYDESKTKHLTHDWLGAIERFANSSVMADILGKKYRNLYAAVKRHEAQTLMASVTDIDRQTYLTRL